VHRVHIHSTSHRVPLTTGNSATVSHLSASCCKIFKLLSIATFSTSNFVYQLCHDESSNRFSPRRFTSSLFASGMTSEGDSGRAVLVSVVLRLVAFIVVWTLLIAATGGCRCGRVESHRPDVDQGSTDSSQLDLNSIVSSTPDAEQRAERLNAIKADILSKLGVDSESNLPSVTSEIGRQPLQGKRNSHC